MGTQIILGCPRGPTLWRAQKAAVWIERQSFQKSLNRSGASAADCARSTVYEAIHALERAGILSWVNRIARIREWGPDLFGRAQNRWRVIRTSNAYTFVDPQRQARPATSSKSDLPTGTEDQESFSLAPHSPDAANPLHQALLRWERMLKGAAPSGAAKSWRCKWPRPLQVARPFHARTLTGYHSNRNDRARSGRAVRCQYQRGH